MTGSVQSPAGSLAFSGAVGVTVPATQVLWYDRLLDPARFPSEGYWAFCRFESDAIPAVRLGFQRGGFNAGPKPCKLNPSYLQLHLEVMTREGALLWLPSGVYPAERVESAPTAFNIRLADTDHEIFEFSGWPQIQCRFRSEDRYLEVDLGFDLGSVTVLPDGILPHCVFAMFESMGNVQGTIRSGGQVTAVRGKAFVDHTRIIEQRNPVVARQMSLYTTLYFEDGSGLYGYYAVDANDRPIAEYCFGVFLNPDGQGRFFADATLTQLALDEDRIAKSWRLRYRMDDGAVEIAITVRPQPILRCWGSPTAPQRRDQFSILPLVLDSLAQFVGADGTNRTLRGIGLSEYYDRELWPIDPLARLD
ncbi:MAG: hypothetical protein WB646_05590 [Steroidobacteraceae bacterium]